MKTTKYAHAKKNIFKKNYEFAIFTRFYLIIGLIGECFLDDYDENDYGRVLTLEATIYRSLNSKYYGSGMTVDKCKKICFENNNFKYAGVETEIESQCFCDNVMSHTTPASDCNTECSGDNSQICGGPYRINVYQKK